MNQLSMLISIIRSEGICNKECRGCPLSTSILNYGCDRSAADKFSVAKRILYKTNPSAYFDLVL